MSTVSSIRIHDTLGPSQGSSKILYINPNSTLSFTQETVSHFSYLSPELDSSNVRIDFYTCPSTGPKSIDGVTDGTISTYIVLGDLGLLRHPQAEDAKRILKEYSVIIIGCFSAHPLVPVLKELLSTSSVATGKFEAHRNETVVLGIMECGVEQGEKVGRYGIATTGLQWEPLFDTAIRGYPPSFDKTKYVGTQGTGFDAVSLHGDGPSNALFEASVELVEKGAEAIVLGCAGMAPMRSSIQDRLESHFNHSKSIPVVDGVQSAFESALQIISASTP